MPRSANTRAENTSGTPQYQRNSDQFQRIDENGTKGCNPIGSEIPQTIGGGKDSVNKAENQANDDLPVRLFIPGHSVL